LPEAFALGKRPPYFFICCFWVGSACSWAAAALHVLLVELPPPPVSAVLLLLSAVLMYQATHQAERRAARKPVPVEQWSQEYVKQLRGSWHDFLQLDLAESTHMSYGWHVPQYCTFCRAAGVTEVPVAQVLGQFVVGRAQHGYALSTIEPVTCLETQFIRAITQPLCASN
jgi:hypothetical protein